MTQSNEHEDNEPVEPEKVQRIHADATLVTIGPRHASQLLAARWPQQRAIRQSHVTDLAHDMKAGHFHLTGDAIVVVQGKLANGQHRLEAIIESGTPCRFILFKSNDPELYKVMDVGMRRLARDSLVGRAYANSIPPIARWVIAYNQRAISSSGVQRRYFKATPLDIVNYCQKNYEALEEAAAFVATLYTKTTLLPMSVGGALYMLVSRHGSKETVQNFLTEIYEGGGTSKSATAMLRNRLIQNKGSKAKLRLSYIFGITIKAYQSFKLGLTPGQLKLVEGGKFPRLDEDPREEDFTSEQ